MASQFSKDGTYFAQIAGDGKLKLWITSTSTLEQEFTPDFHLTAPCTCLTFIQQQHADDKNAPPRKKKKKNPVGGAPDIALATTSGLLLIYSIGKAELNCLIDSGLSQPINCLSTSDQDENLIYSGTQSQILVWNLNKRSISDKWSSGSNEKISAILALPKQSNTKSKLLLTASKNIKLWDINSKTLLRSFRGHSSEVNLLYSLSARGQGSDSYFLSASKGDRLLNCWNLGDDGRNSIVSLQMEDVAHHLSVYVNPLDGMTNVAATVRSGVVHIYQHTLNGKCTKPLKPKTTIQVASDPSLSEKSDVIAPIRITCALFRDDATLSVGYGSDLVQVFENVEISGYKKLQCLLRRDPHHLVDKKIKNENVPKIKEPVVGNDVHYLSSIASATPSKRKSAMENEVPMERRLENLTLSLSKFDSGVPKGDNVAQLLLQGLHSKDKSILHTVLYNKKDEQVIRNTMKRLPMTAIVPLVEELTRLIQGKTLCSQIGSLWLKSLIQVHSALLLSNPDLAPLFSTVLGGIEARLTLQLPLSRLKGRLDLLVSQVGQKSVQEAEKEEEPLLVFNDKLGLSDDDEQEEEIAHSDSDNEWAEDSSDGEEENNENGEDENMSGSQGSSSSEGGDDDDENMAS